MKVVREIYIETKKFPIEEKYGLVNQLRRSAVSIPSNIAEGASRPTIKDYIKYLYISLGSLSEFETQLIISSDLGYINSDHELFNDIIALTIFLNNQIGGLKRRKGGLRGLEGTTGD